MMKCLIWAESGGLDLCAYDWHMLGLGAMGGVWHGAL